MRTCESRTTEAGTRGLSAYFMQDLETNSFGPISAQVLPAHFSQDMFKSYFLPVWNAAGVVFFFEKMSFLDFVDMLNSKKLQFCEHVVDFMESLLFDMFSKRRGPKFHPIWSDSHGEISHMRPIQARKLKLIE